MKYDIYVFINTINDINNKNNNRNIEIVILVTYSLMYKKINN